MCYTIKIFETASMEYKIVTCSDKETIDYNWSWQLRTLLSSHAHLHPVQQDKINLKHTGKCLVLWTDFLLIH